jgi:hypothetical protein
MKQCFIFQQTNDDDDDDDDRSNAILQEYLKMVTRYLFLMESELELHHLTIAKRITVGSHRLVHGRRSTPQNLGTHFMTF